MSIDVNRWEELKPESPDSVYEGIIRVDKYHL